LARAKLGERIDNSADHREGGDLSMNGADSVSWRQYHHCRSFEGNVGLMAQRAGSANLPLHGGQVPRWLADRMTRLGAVISEAIVHHYGRDELLRRLAHPFWF
jgi:hypothetical protein